MNRSLQLNVNNRAEQRRWEWGIWERESLLTANDKDTHKHKHKHKHKYRLQSIGVPRPQLTVDSLEYCYLSTGLRAISSALGRARAHSMHTVLYSLCTVLYSYLSVQLETRDALCLWLPEPTHWRGAARRTSTCTVLHDCVARAAAGRLRHLHWLCSAVQYKYTPVQSSAARRGAARHRDSVCASPLELSTQCTLLYCTILYLYCTLLTAYLQSHRSEIWFE